MVQKFLSKMKNRSKMKMIDKNTFIQYTTETIKFIFYISCYHKYFEILKAENSYK